METKTVGEFNRWLKVAFDFINTKLNYVIRGEISSINIHQSGHVYATLKENNDSVKIIIWRSVYQRKNLRLEIGQNIEIIGKINYYEPTSSISLVVSNFNFLDENGLLKKKLEQLDQEFELSGYYKQENKKKFPEKITNVAIVTAKTGDAINDIVKTFNRRNNLIKLVLYPCLVQGINAKFEIASRIHEINNQSKYEFDAIIVGRGGGSFEDLFSFNEREVIEAIYNSKIFTISAVGHEADVMLSDKVADLRASTPTAAAELLTKMTLSDYKNEIEHHANYLDLFFNSKIDFKINYLKNFDIQSQIETRIKGYVSQINLDDINLNRSFEIKKNKLLNYNEFFNIVNLRLNNFQQHVQFEYLDYINKAIKIKENKLVGLDELITNLGPKSVLNRGYSLIRDKNNKIIKDVSEINSTDIINIKMRNGEFQAKKVSDD